MEAGQLDCLFAKGMEKDVGGQGDVTNNNMLFLTSII